MAKKAQSTLINMLLSLTIIAVVAAAALAFVNAVTAEPIAQAQKAKKEAAIKAVLPAFDRIEETTIDGTASLWSDSTLKAISPATKSSKPPKPLASAPRLANGSRKVTKATLSA